MTEDQIERRVESKIDAIDRAFMTGRMTQAEYDAAIKAVDVWATMQYRLSPPRGEG